MEPITFEEYEAAYRRFVECLHESGVEIVERGLDPEHQMFEYAIPDDSPPGESSGPPDQACYDKHYADADMRWQLQKKAPYADERFSQALAFFAERGVTDFPPEYIEAGNLGGLLHHARSVLGEHISFDYAQFETGFEIRRRVAGLETAPAPEPWTSVVDNGMHHLLAVGFSADGAQLLVIGGIGRSVLDVATGETLAEDTDQNLDSHLTESRQQIVGIGPLGGELVPISGFFGGGLATCTSDNWWLFRCGIEWPNERVVLQAPDANIHNSFKGLTQLPGSMREVRAAGFSPDGRSLVVATTDELKIWRR